MSANLNTEIRATIEGAIAEAFPSIPTAWQNVPFTPPNSLWIRPTIGYGGEAPVAMRRDSLVGALVVEVFAPLEKGSAAVLNIIGVIKATFYRKRVGNIRFVSILSVRQLEPEKTDYLGYAIDLAYQANSDS